MFYLVEMFFNGLPESMSDAEKEQTMAREREYSQSLQRAGKFRHMWRIVGKPANFSVFDVDSNEELQTILAGFPLFPRMTMTVTPLAQHPSAIAELYDYPTAP